MNPIFLESGAIMSLSSERFIIGQGVPQRCVKQELDFNKPAFYFSDFFCKSSHPWIQFDAWLEISHSDLYDQLQLLGAEDNFEDNSLNCEWKIEVSQFKAAFDELMQSLQDGCLQKAVPYVFAKTTQLMHKKRLVVSLLKALSTLKYNKGFLYGFWGENQGILGVTPELLFSHSIHMPKQVQTMALAGTSKYAESFIDNAKERFEHQCVVQGICESLHSLGSVDVGEIQLYPLKDLFHLMTPIELKLNQYFDFEEMVNRLHPTPALGAFPVEKGKEWLIQYDRHTPRYFYGAPIGFQYLQKGLSQCFVGIRNVQWNEKGMFIGAGCGVVNQSIFEKEWQEIQLKTQATRGQLQL